MTAPSPQPVLAAATAVRELARERGVDLASPRDGVGSTGPEPTDIEFLAALDQLLGRLPDDDQEALTQAAISLNPMTVEDLADSVYGDSPTEQQLRTTAESAARLLQLGLLVAIPGAAGAGEVIVHAWLAQALQRGEPDLERHRRAGEMRRRRLTAPHRTFSDFEEVARHLAVTKDFESIVLFGRAVARPGILPPAALATLLDDLLVGLPAAQPGYLQLGYAQARALIANGDSTTGLQRLGALCDVATVLGNRDPDNLDAQHDVCFYNNAYGDRLVEAGRADEAEPFYRDSVILGEVLVAAHPDDRLLRHDLGIAYDRLGNVLFAAGQSEAVRLYGNYLVIAEAQAAESEEPADQRGLPIAYERVMTVLNVVGEGIGIPTDADLLRAYERLADVMERLGESADALLFVRRALTIAERLALPAPGDGQSDEQRLRVRAILLDQSLGLVDPL